jgi:hypothetical protein
MRFFLIDDFWQGDECITILAGVTQKTRFTTEIKYFFAHYYPVEDVHVIYEKTLLDDSILLFGLTDEIQKGRVLIDVTTKTKRKARQARGCTRAANVV